MDHLGVAVAGIYEYPARLAEGMSALQIKAQCARNALRDAGLTWSDVNAFFDAGETGPGSMFSVVEYLGVNPSVLDGTAVGGSSFEFHVAHATSLLQSGRAKVALLTYGSTARSERRPIGTGPRLPTSPGPGLELEAPYGLPLVGSYALAARRHMAMYGTSPEALAEIAVVTRAHALRNPAAVRGMADMGRGEMKGLSTADVLNSRIIADPLHLYDCCIVSDGGGAVVLVSAGAAADLRKAPVWVLGVGESIAYPSPSRDITISAGAASGKTAFERARVKPTDIDIAMVYDSFTITVLIALEDLGFTPKGEGGAYVADGGLRYDQPGKPALNTDGGGLSSNHPGMRGVFLLIEATRQLRGESTSQVPDASLAVAHGNGGQLGNRHSASTVILGGTEVSESQEVGRPLPDIDSPDLAVFWQETRSHRLTYMVCESCGTVQAHHRRHCSNCLDGEPVVRVSRGVGRIYTYTEIRQHTHRYFSKRVPYVLGFIDLDEGFRMLTEIQANGGTVSVGAEVEVTWEDHENVSIPIFSIR